jgi:hypothetical protein
LGVWLVGEFGEMLVNGSCKSPDGSPLIIDDSEIINIYEKVLIEHNLIRAAASAQAESGG